MEINETYDYSKFKFLSCNRKVGSNKNLSKSIEMANHKGSIKRIRSNEKKRIANRCYA